MQTQNLNIGIHTAEGISFLSGSTILYILAEGSHSWVVLDDQRKLNVARKLGELEKSLPEQFFRIHHSHIINLHHVVRYVKEGNGQVVLTNGEMLAVSRVRRKGFLERFRIL